MRRILIFSTAYLPLAGGAEIAVRELAARMNGFSFDLLAARLRRALPPREQLGAVDVHRLGAGSALDKWLLPWTAYRKAVALHRERPYDAIWVVMASYAAFAASRFKRRFPDVPMLLTLQEGDPPESIARKTRFVRGAFRNIFRRADALQAISGFLLVWGRSQGFDGPAEVVPNGVDLARFRLRLSEEERRAVRAARGFGGGDAVIVTASRLVRKNGVDLLLRALALLPEQVKLLVAGEGEERARLEALARELSLGERAVFAGEAGHDVLPKLLAASDLFCRPSRSEGMGNAFVEAMAAGLPVIGTDVGGIPDVIKDGANGLLVPPESPEAVAAAVRRLLGDAELARRLAEAGRASAEAHDWDVLAPRLSSAFERLFRA